MTRVLLILVVLSAASCKRSPEDIACGAKGETYFSCGCGCCPSNDPIDTSKYTCVDTTHGDTLGAIKARDAALKSSGKCAMMGCSQGELFKCCD